MSGQRSKSDTMLFLKNLPRFVFFTGKGGVGKTSIACSTSVKLARAGKKVLLVSTDPASNVGQVFGQDIGNTITAINSVPNLDALEIDPQQAAQAYRNKIIGPARGVLAPDVVANMEEQLSGACTTEIAAFDEFTELLVDSELTSAYDHIVFDTAPTGHTIRLLQLPGAWSGFLESGKGDASCLGPLAGLDKQRSQYGSAVASLSDPTRTRLVLVSRPQRSSLKEVERTFNELAAIGLLNQYLVINGSLPYEEGAHDDLALAILDREKAALNTMPDVLRSLPRDVVDMKPFNIVGINALNELLEKDVTLPTSMDPVPPPSITAPELSTLVDEIARDGKGLIMLMGKGGVGKTTIAAAVAVELAHRGHTVHLTTSDPAAHLQETLGGAMENLDVSRIDPREETERYKQHIMRSKGYRLDDAGKALLEEDLRSPCTEEIAVFHAFSRVIREANRQFVVMDTAPTGHTLLLLDTTGAYHRDVSRQMGKSGMHFTTPMMQLQDQLHTKVLIVTLAETTPVLEAASLQEDLRRAGIEPWAWVINNSIAAAKPSSPFLTLRAHNELPEIERVSQSLAHRYAVVPLLKREPVGLAQLLAIASPDVTSGE